MIDHVQLFGCANKENALKKKVISQKTKTITKAVRTRLIKTVLNIVPLHYIHFFKMPEDVANEIVGTKSEKPKKAWRLSWGEQSMKNTAL